MLDLLFYFLFGLSNSLLTLKLYHLNNKRRDLKFLRHLMIEHRGASTITLTSVSSSDREALDKIKEQLDEH